MTDDNWEKNPIVLHCGENKAWIFRQEGKKKVILISTVQCSNVFLFGQWSYKKVNLVQQLKDMGKGCCLFFLGSFFDPHHILNSGAKILNDSSSASIYWLYFLYAGRATIRAGQKAQHNTVQLFSSFHGGRSGTNQAGIHDAPPHPIPSAPSYSTW